MNNKSRSATGEHGAAGKGNFTKKARKEFEKQCQYKERRFEKEAAQVRQRSEREMNDSYVFLLDSSLSTRQSARRVLENTEVGLYFDYPTNLAFDDFTGGRDIPRAAKIVLGSLGSSLEH